MMRPSQVLALVVAGIALAGAGGWLVSRRGTDGTVDAQAQVLPLKQDQLNAVTRLRIFKGDGSHATLTRAAARWIVTERAYPADTGQVRKLLLDLASLQVEELKTGDPDLYSKLGVEDPSGASASGTGIDIDLNGKTLRLIVGKTSGTRSVYVRVPGGVQSVLASPQLAPDADPRHWLDRALVDLAPDQIGEIDIKTQGGPDYSISRAGADASSGYVVSPIPKGRQLADPSAPGSQAAALAGLQFDDVRQSGAIAATAHAGFHSRDGLNLALAGIQDGERRYVSVAATASAPAAEARARELNARLAGWEFELPGYRYDALFRPLEQLLVPLPSKSPAAAAKSGLPFGPQGESKSRGTSQSKDKATPQLSH